MKGFGDPQASHSWQSHRQLFLFSFNVIKLHSKKPTGSRARRIDVVTADLRHFGSHTVYRSCNQLRRLNPSLFGFLLSFANLNRLE
jgi:hypothetical protein